MKKYLCMLAISAAILFTLAGCIINISTGGSNTPQCTSNCAAGSGAQGARVYVEPDDGEQIITGAIKGARKSVWLEIYILSDRNVIRALEDAANNGIDVRVMLEPHPVGGGTSASKTIDQLKAAGVRAQYTSPDFALTHEKGMIIDGSTAYIMTSNFSRSALGGSTFNARRRCKPPPSPRCPARHGPRRRCRATRSAPRRPAPSPRESRGRRASGRGDR